MNKHLIASGIAVLLICVGLSGCTDNPFDDSSKFVGTWVNFGMTIFTFKSDGTYTSTITKGTYEVEDGKLICKATNFDLVLSYYYTFSDNDNILTLDGIGGADSVTVKRK